MGFFLSEREGEAFLKEWWDSRLYSSVFSCVFWSPATNNERFNKAPHIILAFSFRHVAGVGVGVVCIERKAALGESKVSVVVVFFLLRTFRRVSFLEREREEEDLCCWCC